LQLIANEPEKQAPPTTAPEGGTNPAPSFENDATLMIYFAGEYYSFSAVGGGQTGGTERKMSLCATGKYYSSSE